MPVHDLHCESCSKISKNTFFSQSQYSNGIITGIKCQNCGKDKFTVYWGSGAAPSVTMAASTPLERFQRSKTLGEFWDRSGLEIGGQANKKANMNRIKQMRDKAMRKKKSGD